MSVAKPLPHDAARLHVTGAARYVDDTPTPRGTLHLAFGLSPIAKGRITRMDLEPARQSSGVVAVLSAGDLPFDNDVSPSNHDEPLLTSGAVNYVGQPVFLVAATSHRAARIAARKAVIDYAEETPLLTLEAALAADSRFEEGPRIYQKGDAAAAISAAPRMVEGSFDLGGQEHFYLEGQAALAQPQEDGGMLVNSSTQHPTEIQHKVAEAIGLPMHAVRVETRRMGGGFGGKESQGNALAVACAVAARHTGRPCKMRYDRDDDMVITGKRHAFRISYRAGFDTDGRLMGVEFTHLVDCGWAQDLSLPVADRAMLHADNAYAIPAIRIESHRLKTNRQSATAYRGFGGPQGMVGIERVMDHIAHDLKLDPVELRQRNYYAAPGTATGDNTTPYGMEVSDFELHEMTAQLLVSADYAARKAEIAAWNQGQTHLKRGLAFSPVKFGISFTLTHLNQAGALVHVYQDGSVHLNHGGTEMGQGLFQKVAQVAASRFGILLEKVKITATDTAKVPNTSATAASSGSDLNGMAVKAACDTIRARMAEHLANLHQAAPADVVFADGVVRIGDALELSFDAAAKLCYEGRISLSSTGFYKTPKLEWDRIKGQGRPFFYFAYGAALTEVVVDRLTGENRILRADILHDAGASLNPALDIGQVEGGYVQGAGWLTTEELVWDDKGALRTHAPSTYKIPACSDRPDVFNVALYDGQNREETIYRSKAVGEPPFMLGISAWLALSDAVSAFGAAYPALDAPATAEEIWRAARRTSDGG
ncbi:xanthine dehydrogenase molybdopterin binding subunit [Phaeobacter gallaeciensis]|uniref:xanthine dehydrogenase molybdopterin binding subunit n=1 Tax=Phaeobacter gallaeciensis TaxID=60890 RepID=UPI00237F87BC|nr:xanthine dehydrogenase molybdopterin binding subunit [Phaeobacter gallaeciensis]MDE4190825.1 xanthine dehydrogenase molybdopterin binding subunit [Phaeobacter gallaeciensis]MDE4199291.1 xanthine dehydrogenase molybdopterin binding subunit [Phaeobacter gallaeciensis]MDE4203439.1 xanthine dehydrogenase molybdopterin binding subunit [Phaeobacter gallaeciensis]MDE4207581.1 xanthine dehydrogenase molybdopterin binding subunit [Phaeobacter gallaeciensis]MDE4215948.1 xanthine dehydrogenase molybdo